MKMTRPDGHWHQPSFPMLRWRMDNNFEQFWACSCCLLPVRIIIFWEIFTILGMLSPPNKQPASIRKLIFSSPLSGKYLNPNYSSKQTKIVHIKISQSNYDRSQQHSPNNIQPVQPSINGRGSSNGISRRDAFKVDQAWCKSERICLCNLSPLTREGSKYAKVFLDLKHWTIHGPLNLRERRMFDFKCVTTVEGFTAQFGQKTGGWLNGW